MKLLNRRVIAVILILIGLIALGFGLYILIGIFWPSNPNTADLPGAGTDLPLSGQTTQAPKTYMATSTIPADSTITQNAAPNDLREAVNRANIAVARLGSGTSQDSFSNYRDMLVYGTERFNAYILAEAGRLSAEHPASSPAYGFTTRVIASDLVSGAAGADNIVVKVQSQKAYDAGDRGHPTSVIYEQSLVTLIRQGNGTYLIDEIVTSQVNE